MTDDLFSADNAAHYMVWGNHPAYANGQWIKVAAGDDPEMIAMRKREGFKLKWLPVGETPNASKNGGNP